MTRYDIATEPTAAQLATNYAAVVERVRQAAGGRSVTLVAASKTKSPSCLQSLYDCGHRDFGENYVQELVDKSCALPADIRWRLIGHLQSNKIKELLEGAANLALVETVDSAKLATKLDAGCVSYRAGRPLDVYMQINTSGEESKSGVDPGAPTVELATFIATQCPRLALRGLMTIGMPDYTSRPENFECLMRCRAQVADALRVPHESLALSMGMSGDFENAIKMGSTNVRVGSSIFGQRYYPPKSQTPNNKQNFNNVLRKREREVRAE